MTPVDAALIARLVEHYGSLRAVGRAAGLSVTTITATRDGWSEAKPETIRRLRAAERQMEIERGKVA